VQADLLIKTKKKIPYYFTGKAIDYEENRCLVGVGIDFTDRVKAQEKIRETTEQLRMLTAHLQHIREEERKRIGREIHDELGQQLTAIKMDVAWLDKKMPEAETVFKTKLKNIIELLDGSNKSIRRILSELRPGILDDYGLLDALEWLGNQFTANTGVPLNFTAAEKNFKSSAPVVTCIFRVYQEALTNITKYAKATKVLTSLSIEDGIICVRIEDDGKGFTPELVQTHKSFGLLGMKERVLSLGGTFELNSAAGTGTKIAIKLPTDIPNKHLT
jgi:signal transduction histidine kinase